MSKHTPGPWHQSDSTHTTKGHAVCAGERVIARVVGLGYPVGTGWSPQFDADARLIAAAPELLAALQAINAALTQPVQFSGSDATGTCNILRGDCQVAASIARAAIAKATGESDR